MKIIRNLSLIISARLNFSLFFFISMINLIVIFTLFLSCSNGQNDGSKIFTPGSEWVYIVKTLDSNKVIYKIDTLKLTVEEGTFLLRQKKISWSIKNVLPNGSVEEIFEITGVVENSNRVWLHPPRLDFLKFTELTAFPEVKFPTKENSEWSSTLNIGAGWGEWQGVKVKSDYTLLKNNEISISDSCLVVSATSKSKLGTFNTTYKFCRNFGFEYIHYQHPNGSRTKIILLNTNK